MRLGALSSTALVFMLVGTADVARAFMIGEEVTWETGTISGSVVTSGTLSAAFTFDAGDPSGLGIDYAGLATPGDPGTLSAPYTGNLQTTWGPGSLSASSGSDSITLGLTNGDSALTIAFAFAFAADVTSFTTGGAVPSLPSTLADPVFFATTTASNIVTDGGVGNILSFDFAGSYTLTATYVPEPAVSSMLVAGLLTLLGSGHRPLRHPSGPLRTGAAR